MSIIQGTAKPTSGDASFYDFPIGQSLRFSGSSSSSPVNYLSRTFGTPTDEHECTLSFWLKRSKLGMSAVMGAGASGSDYTAFAVINGDGFTPHSYASSAYRFNYSYAGKLRDTSSFYHIVITYKKNETAAVDRLKIYVNSSLLTATSTTTAMSSTFNQDSQVHRIGFIYGGYTGLEGYLAEINFIDGQALDPYFFGESKNGVWIPYNAFSTAGSGTATASDGDTATDSYGNNGFRLTFEDGIESLSVNGSNVNAFRDKSSSSSTNHWKIN